MQKMSNWDKYFMTVAYLVATKSKDPRTKVGAVIVGPDNEIRSSGYNGLPRYIDDSADRYESPLKYDLINHAEENAILNCARVGISTKDCSMYVPWIPCSLCAKSIIQSGIKKVVYHNNWPGNHNQNTKWADSIALTKMMFREANVELVCYNDDLYSLTALYNGEQVDVNTSKTSNEVVELMENMGREAKDAALNLAALDNKTRSLAIQIFAKNLIDNLDYILEENQKDLEAATGLSKAMIDRLTLNKERVHAIANSALEVAALPDPLGIVLDSTIRPNGLVISSISVPIGVIGIIYESRPNVTADAACLCIKSGNSAILRGGSESFRSSVAIMKMLNQALISLDIDPNIVQLVPTTSREAVNSMLTLTEYIDVIIPRGGANLTNLVYEQSKVPTLLHLTGNCHTYIHKNADLTKTRNIIKNAKMRRTGVCGATESLVIDKEVAAKILPSVISDLTSLGCEIRGDEFIQKLSSNVKPATEEDFGTEYLDAIISIKAVDNIDEAIEHINHYGSHHTDAIITENFDAAEIFLKNIDSAIVMHNTSTQFADGNEFGLGAEIGIATGKLHARGPVGIRQLTTYKYIVSGDGQVRS